MAKFSLKKGVFKSFYMKVHPGPLPMGSAADAKLRSDKTHKYDLPLHDSGDDVNYKKAFEQIKLFLGVDNLSRKSEIPPLFVTPAVHSDDFKAAKMTLQKILLENDEKNFEFRVYPTEYLLYNLQQKRFSECPEKPIKVFSSPLTALDALQKDTFMYSDIGCKFHRIHDSNQHCCLSKVKRWCFCIASFCLDPSVNRKIPGLHMPSASCSDSDEEESAAAADNFDAISDSFRSLNLDTRTTISSITKPSSSASTYSVVDSEFTDTESTTANESIVTLGSETTLSSFVSINRGRSFLRGFRGASRGRRQ